MREVSRWKGEREKQSERLKIDGPAMCMGRILGGTGELR